MAPRRLSGTICLAILAVLMRCGAAKKETHLFDLKGEGVTPIGDPASVGGGLIFDCEVACQGNACPKGSARVYERLGRCVTVHVEPSKGAWMSCSVESYFPAGSVLMEVRWYSRG
jgi:hypothetical protein